MRLYILFSFVFILFSCKEKIKSNADVAEVPQQNANTTVDTKRSGLPAITIEIMKKMIAEVDYIDYIMHDLPFSISQDTKGDINSNIMFISNIPAGDVAASCKPIGRKFYNIKGETYMSADIYFSNGCSFYIFLDGEKPIYSAKFTKEGYNFYTQIIAQGQKASEAARAKINQATNSK